jgi:hypothetical protein
MKKLIFISFSLIFISCYPKAKLEIFHNEFSEPINYLLDNNKLISSDPTHEIELNIQKSISNNKSEYLIILECIGSSQIGLTESSLTTFLIDNKKISINPQSTYILPDIDPELILETGHYITNFNFIKNIAYSNQTEIKISGKRKIIYAHLSLQNKLNIQKFIESFISLEEQVRPN